MTRILILTATVLALAGLGPPGAQAPRHCDVGSDRALACWASDRQTGPFDRPTGEGRAPQRPQDAPRAPGTPWSPGTLWPQPDPSRDRPPIIEVQPCYDWHICRVG